MLWEDKTTRRPMKNTAVELNVSEITIKEQGKVINSHDSALYTLLEEKQNQKSQAMHYNCRLFKKDNTQLQSAFLKKKKKVNGAGGLGLASFLYF